MLQRRVGGIYSRSKSKSPQATTMHTISQSDPSTSFEEQLEIIHNKNKNKKLLTIKSLHNNENTSANKPNNQSSLKDSNITDSLDIYQKLTPSHTTVKKLTSLGNIFNHIKQLRQEKLSNQHSKYISQVQDKLLSIERTILHNYFNH